MSTKKSHILKKPAAEIVGNKAKGRISKRVLQENKARQIFRKMNISYPQHAHVFNGLKV